MSESYELEAANGEVEGGPFPVLPGGLIIGRSPDVEIVIADQVVSRRHARVWLEGGAVTVDDLGSRNGVLVNGKQVRHASLSPGDTLTVGEVVFNIVKREDLLGTQAVITFDSGSTLCETFVQGESGRFPVLYKAAQLLGSVFDLDELLEQILAVVFESLPVSRGFVLTLSKDTGALEVRTSLSRDDNDAGPPLSHGILDHVIAKRESILTLDAQDDSRFRESRSIVGYHIHAAMCAPMYGRESIVGAIYVDSGQGGGAYADDDLQLLTVIARVVGVAVENARLYQETLERERLAALGQAMAGVGHCVKNILTAIKGGGEFIDMAVERNDTKYLSKGWPIMRRATERIEMLMLNMLTFARDRQPECMATDIDDLVLEVISMSRSRAEKLNVEIEFVQGNVATVLADGRELFRVLLNLMTNALDACETEGGKVTITTKREERGITIIIADTGIGIPPEIMPKLFQAFVSSKGSGGTGLGLACSQKIVRAHGGEITAQSEPGKGAEFTVFLPPWTGTG